MDTSTLKNCFAASTKVEYAQILFGSLLGTLPKEMHAHIYKKFCTGIVIATSWKQL